MPQPVGGRVFIKVNGEQLAVRANVTSNIGQTVNRETVTGVDSVHGFMESPIAPYLQADLTERPAFSLADLNGVSEATVTAELADGRTLILRDAWQVGELERNANEGSISSVRFEGLSGEEA